MRFFLLTIIGLFSLIMVSCIEDGITTSSSDVLSFSRDTVSFDTIFTDLGTPTARLVVSNKAKKGVLISSIRFKNPDSRFSVNVDGVSGAEFHNVEIRANDSIYVFIECFVPSSEGNTPLLVEDDLEFITNGVVQNVHLEAYGQNVTRLRNVKLSADTRFSADRPYVIFDSLVVEKGVTLSIDPGAQLLFHDGAELVIRGKLEAIGSPDKKINMRGDRLDNVLPDVGYDIMAGQWRGVSIAAESFDNRMEYVDMRSTVIGLSIDSCADLSRQKLTLLNSWLHNSQNDVIRSDYSKVDAYGCCFSEAGGAVVALKGGSHEFVHCTIANNYLFSAIRYPLLSLYHCLPDEMEEGNMQPLMAATFSNCIIYGLSDDINHGDLTGSNVTLRYVSLKSAGSDDDNFINCIWDTDPLFLTNRPEYYFNYRLKNDSPIISAGDATFVSDKLRYDMDGNDRLKDGSPTPGAYQFVPQAE